MKNKSEVDVFLGAPITDATEKKFLARLRRDLDRMGLRARVLANLQVGRDRRQVDFVLVLPERVVLCEVKGFQGKLVGGANGFWKQRLPDGSLRSLLSNPIRQAHDQSYALSDEIRSFASEISVPRVQRGAFFKHFETTVCIFPSLAPGSKLDKHPYVTVFGYEDLLAVLPKPGKYLPWQSEHWDEVILRMGLFRLGESNQEEITRQEEAGILEDYRRRFRVSHGVTLPPLVPTRCLLKDQKTAQPIPDLSIALAAGRSVFLCGPSGFGKSHLAEHTAAAMATKGHLPIWVKANGFEGSLETTLRQATAPFATRTPSELIRMATGAGAEIVLFVDGLNEVPQALREKLLTELSAFRLRTGSALLFTSQTVPPLPEGVQSEEMRLLPPSAIEREALLDAYQAPDVVRVSEAFKTPFELSIAVACAAEMDIVRTRAELLDAYISKQVESESIRAVLRRLAERMHDELRGSLPAQDTMRMLQRGGLTSQMAEAAFSTPLLRVGQGRVAFAHEELARFLAAESKVLNADEGEALTKDLQQPQNIDLQRDVLAIESDVNRLRAALSAVSESAVLSDAARGVLGGAAQKVVKQFLDDLLDRALEATNSGDAVLEIVKDAPGFMDKWVGPWEWSGLELAGFDLIGEQLRDGLRVSRVIELLDATDALCHREVEGLSAVKEELAIDFVMAATYSHALNPERALPASLIASACGHSRFMRYENRPAGPVALASTFLDAAGEKSWGLFYVMATLFDAETDDQVHLPRALRLAWEAKGYHLRLQALQMAEFSAASVEGSTHDEVASILQSVHSGNLVLNSMLVEALATYDLIDSGKDEEVIESEIRAVIAQEVPMPAELARGYLSDQFEDERIVGPYYRVIMNLPEEERAELLRLGLEASQGYEIGTELFLRELAECGDLERKDVQAVFNSFAQPPAPVEGGGIRQFQFETRCFIEAIYACAKFRKDPPFEQGGSVLQLAWSTVGEIIFWRRVELLGGQVPKGRSDSLWKHLRGTLRPAVADVFQLLRDSDRAVGPEATSPHQELLATHRVDLCEIFCWSLAHQGELIGVNQFSGSQHRARYLVEVLGEIGGQAAAASLRKLASDSQLGRLAVQAIRAIEGNDQPAL